MASPLTVYITRPAAPLCERVCAFLEGRGYAYTTIDVVTDDDRLATSDSDPADAQERNRGA